MICRQLEFFKVCLSRIALQRTKQELVLFVVLYNELNTAAAKITDAIEQHDFFTDTWVHGIKLKPASAAGFNKLLMDIC